MVKGLKLTDFTCFGDVSLDFCSGINVFIGANATGKTHLLKLVAACLKAGEELTNGALMSRERAEAILSSKLLGYFRPERMGRLVRRKQGRTRSEVKIKIQGSTALQFNFATNSQNVKIENFQGLPKLASLYLPPREMLSLYEGFISLYEGREVAFDETYYQLAKALNSPLLRGARLSEIKDLVEPIEVETGVRIVRESERFYLKEAGDKLEMHLVAEGMRKIATIIYLLTNGKLSKNTVLFWDEPEANLNPRLVRVVAKLLRQLADSKIQIFIATHDFLLTHYLSLFQEYAETPKPELRFFSLQKDEEQGIVIEQGETLAALQNNLILDEFAMYHDLEQAYFNQALTH
ncbi:MAG: ATP-binding protein [Haliscomenobacteraceae bacterium CHB4]|nr:hypothetical protein [Saprospiraceae bacterium]MCE7925163.1 ATP-binding protein [Haliscomenobacteraceae bacterium CHB4]